jgi:hypothetical protein
MVTPGHAKSMNVVIRGKKPFKIAELSHVNRQVRLKPADDNLPAAVGTDPVSPSSSMPDEAFKMKCPDTTAVVHMVALTFTPPAEPGLFEEEFVLKIDGRAQPITFRVKGRILDQTLTEKR